MAPREQFGDVHCYAKRRWRYSWLSSAFGLRREWFEMKNVFNAILECGHDEDFAPAETDEFGAD